MNRYRMYERADRGGTYYWEDSMNRQQGSLKTKNREDAEKLLHAKNETARQPHLNRELGRVYIKAADPAMATRTWQDVMDSYCGRQHLRESSLDRTQRAFAGRQFDPIRKVIVTETSTEAFLSLLEKARNSSTNHYLRRLHNYAMNLGWLPWHVVPKATWPRPTTKRRRGITAQEHERIIAVESNLERRRYYELLWLTGASQSDAADLTAERVDWDNGILAFSRKKLRPDDPPCILRIGPKLSALLRELPQKGPLFPTIRNIEQKQRSAEFCRRCRLLNLRGISLHCYRHGWAERAEISGMPERYAMAALGHASKAVHRAYARAAAVAVPSLEVYEEKAKNVVAFPSPALPIDKQSEQAMLTLLLPAVRQALLAAGRDDTAHILKLLSDKAGGDLCKAV